MSNSAYYRTGVNQMSAGEAKVNLILETSFHTATTKWEDSSKTAHPNKHSSSNNGETFFNQSPLTKGRNEVSLNKRNCCMLNHEGTLIFSGEDEV